MNNKIIFSLPNNEMMADKLTNLLDATRGLVEVREFPDGESYVRIHNDVKNKDVILVCTLDHPNSKILPLFFMIQTIKELGAKSICLVAPYLAYMRQDSCFHPGEAVTSRQFANYLSQGLDKLITIDPHLHRIKDLATIYTIPNISVLHATQEIATWIQNYIKSPFLIGPDEESEQWVAEIATYINIQYVICKKRRLGDRQLDLHMPNIKNIGKTPVIVDDIISTGSSMLAVVQLLIAQEFNQPVCIGVHALFDGEVANKLRYAGVTHIVSCNTILHASNQIDITSLIAKQIHNTPR